MDSRGPCHPARELACDQPPEAHLPPRLLPQCRSPERGLSFPCLCGVLSRLYASLTNVRMCRYILTFAHFWTLYINDVKMHILPFLLKVFEIPLH